MNLLSYFAQASIDDSGTEPVAEDVVVLTGVANGTIIKSIKVSTTDACVVNIKYVNAANEELFAYRLNLEDFGYVMLDSFDVVNSGHKLVFNADQASCKLKADVVEQ